MGLFGSRTSGVRVPALWLALAASAGSLSCTDDVSLGAWGNAGASATGGSAGAGATGGSAGGSATGGNAGAGGATSWGCPRPGVPGARNPAGAEIGMTNTYTDFTWPAPSDSFEFAFQLENELTNDGYFWSHGFDFVGGAGGFIGLQYRGGYQADPPNGGVQTENMAVFWISDSPIRAELGDVAYPSARTYLNPDMGSMWWTIHVLYDWQVCRRYHLRVGRQASEPNGDIWYGAWVRDGVTNVETFLGRILVPAAWGRFATDTTMWTARIGFTPVTACDQPERASAVFGFPTADGGSMQPITRRNRFSEPPRCSHSRFTDFPDAVRHEVAIAP